MCLHSIWILGDILATAGSERPSVVIFRLQDQTPTAVNPRLFRVIAACAEELASGVIVIVEDERFRVRRTDPDLTRALREWRYRCEMPEADLSFQSIGSRVAVIRTPGDPAETGAGESWRGSSDREVRV